MSVILYARVSTGEQAERDLSLPAQLRALRRLAEERGWGVATEYQDVGSGKSFRERPGLVAAVNHALRDHLVDAILVHRVDRLARNTLDYLTLKAKLRNGGIRIVSVVEHFESNPMGEFLEHVMAAQAEFYSANLAMEVRKGLEERLRCGKWTGAPPVGYVQESSRLVLDPARAPLLRDAFRRWATGTVTSIVLADELHRQGLVGRHGRPIRASHLCTILKSPFYVGIMVVGGVRYPGSHPPLVTDEVFKRGQEVFRQKQSGGRPRRKLTFVLAGKLFCPGCGGMLVGEEHLKPSGRRYRYYRCHRRCHRTLQADPIEREVCAQLAGLPFDHAILALQLRLRTERKRAADEVVAHLQVLRAERAKLADQYKTHVRTLLDGIVNVDRYDERAEELRHAMRTAEFLMKEAEESPETVRGDRAMLVVAESAPDWCRAPDPVLQRRAVDALVCRITIDATTPRIDLMREWNRLFTPDGGRLAATV